MSLVISRHGCLQHVERKRGGGGGEKETTGAKQIFQLGCGEKPGAGNGGEPDKEAIQAGAAIRTMGQVERAPRHPQRTGAGQVWGNLNIHTASVCC